MEPAEILTGNHDLHTHTSRFSDAWHSPEEVFSFAMRWNDGVRYAGISEHSPAIEDALVNLHPGESPSQQKEYSDAMRRGAMVPLDLQRWMDEKTGQIIAFHQGHRFDVEKKAGGAMLVGLELDWFDESASIRQDALTGLDYCLCAYHGRRFQHQAQAEQLLLRMTDYPFCDVVAHPDAFLGDFPVSACNWELIFNRMAENGVLCEYNLTTPLQDDILLRALHGSEVKFIIGSDIHDFRCRSTRRIMDAWSESQAGGFEIARAYLLAMLQDSLSAGDLKPCRELFATPQALSRLEARMYARIRKSGGNALEMSPHEVMIYQALDDYPGVEHDREFLLRRLERFASVPRERIASTWKQDELVSLLKEGRQRREMR